MKLDKEYPATHSMSTAWYVADEEGNVGIMDFNENGPVPLWVEDTSVEDLVFGHREDIFPDQCQMIALTDKQVDDLLENPHSPEKENLWWDCIIQIDKEKEGLFLELAKNEDFKLEYCVSKNRGLYCIDASCCLSDAQKDDLCPIKEKSSLKKMLDLGLILQIFHKKDFWMNDEYDDNQIIHNKNFSSAPYYIFHQPYWNDSLPECMNVPEYPVKLEQLPEKLRKRVLRLPIKFKDTKNFQIAEWYPCTVYSGCDFLTESVAGCEYKLMPTTNGIQAYVLSDMIRGWELLDDCVDCQLDCDRYTTLWFTEKPTVLVIVHPVETWSFSEQTSADMIVAHSIWLPFVPKFPLSAKGNPACWSEENRQNCISGKDIKDDFTLRSFFTNHRHWLEQQIQRFNPRVVLVGDEAKSTVSAVYTMNDNCIEINGVSYPMYLLPELETHREEIERLASLPYQGKPIPHIISVEEMEKIKQGK